ncbi:MAG: MBG domain-containing protein [bacterium]
MTYLSGWFGMFSTLSNHWKKALAPCCVLLAFSGGADAQAALVCDNTSNLTAAVSLPAGSSSLATAYRGYSIGVGSSACTVTSVTFAVYGNSTGTADLVFRLYRADGSMLPYGSPIATTILSNQWIDLLAASTNFYTVSPGWVLDPNTNYAFALAYQHIDVTARLPVTGLLPELGSGFSTGKFFAATSEITTDRYALRVMGVEMEPMADLSVSNGPAAGGNTVIVTNCVPAIGNGSDVTNVTVGGVAATAIVGQGANWVSIVMPAGTAGAVDITVESASLGSKTYSGIYTYNPAGSIGVPIRMMEYRISFYGNGNPPYDIHSNIQYPTNFCPDGAAVYTHVNRTNDWMELATTNRDRLDRNGAMIKAFDYNSDFGSGWQDGLGGYDWIATNAAQWFIFSSARPVTNWITVTDLRGTNYQVDVVNSFSGNYKFNEQLHPGAWNFGDNPDIGNWGTNVSEWQNPGGGGSWLNVSNAYWWRDRFITWSNVVPQNRALTLVLWDTNGVPCNFLNCMRIRGDEPLGDVVLPSSGLWTGGYSVVINGTNLGNGVDITNVTLCGVSGTSIDSQSATQVVVTAGVASSAGPGDVRVYSTSYGETVQSNGFTYLATDQTITFPAIGAQLTTNRIALAATASSGLAVSFAVGSGPASIAGGTNLTFTGTGSVWIVASQAGNANWNAAPDVTNTFDVTKATAGVYLQDLAQVYDGTARSVTATTDPSGLTVTFTYDGLGTAPTNVGTYAVTGTVSDVTYMGAATDTLTVSKAGQTITFPALGDKVMTDTVVLAATADSGLAVSFAVGSGPASITNGTNLAFTGAGMVSIVASQAGDANWNAAPEVTNTVRVYGLYTLAVATSHGAPEPAVGVYTNLEDLILTNTVTEPSDAGGTQFVCVGWFMTGQNPIFGSTTSFVMTVTNDAVLTWLWTTNFWLDTGADVDGSVNVDDGWQAIGISTQITAVADTYYHFTNWTGDAAGSANPLDLLMDAPKAVLAHFAANTTAAGTPEPWMAAHGFTNDFENADNGDQDEDGLATWEEFIAGTDPTNAASCFSASVANVYGTNYVESVYTNEFSEVLTNRDYEVLGLTFSWPSVSGRVYDVESIHAVPEPVWPAMSGLTNISAKPPVNVLTNLFADLTNRVWFLRGRVRLE